MGPLTLMDLIGLDVCLEVLEVMYAETRDQRYAAAPLLRRLVMARQLGRKTGRGYYDYSGAAPVAVAVPPNEQSASNAAAAREDIAVAVTGADPGETSEVAKLIEVAGLQLTDVAAEADLVAHVPTAPRRGVVVELAPRTPAGNAAFSRARDALAGSSHEVVVCKDRPGHLVEALLFPHLNDAVRMVDEGYATRDDVDAAMRLGCGYPEGPFQMLAPVGARLVAERLVAIAAAMPSAALAPSPLLHELTDQ
jgi:3-hydroxybutyryl-CoA dehydrogenase